MTLKYTNEQYSSLVSKKTKGSPIVRKMITAFLVGGAICTIGQLILNGYLKAGLDKDTASGATSVSLVFLGALFTGLNVYDMLAKYAGAGSLVPITGFANSIVAPAMEFRTEGLITGVAAKMFSIAGPVLVYGTVASILYGLILLLIRRV
jgi:stage V sporulation protein AC